MTRILAAALAAIALVGVLAAPALAKPTQPAAQFMVDSVRYHGTLTGLSLTAQGRSQVQATNIQASLRMPAAYTNRFCAYAELRVNDRTVARSYTDCDTNGDATLRWYFPDLWVPPATQVSVYFSDPLTRYLAEHPWISV